MSLINGVYLDDDEKPYEFESSYYLGFQISSALISIEYIRSCKYEEKGLFSSKSQYYHYYTDHLLYSIGQIANRFNVNSKNKCVKNRAYINRKIYGFEEETYPILSNKKYRNIIEHIDEYGINAINNYNGVGGFNYIDTETNQEIVDVLCKDRKKHIYTLNVLSSQIYIENKNMELTLDLDDLERELIMLKKPVEDIFRLVTRNY